MRRHSLEFTLEICIVLLLWILLGYGNAITGGQTELGKMTDRVKELLVWEAILLSAVTVWPSRNRLSWLATRMGIRISNGITNKTLAVLIFLYSFAVALLGILLSHLTAARILGLTFNQVSSSFAISVSWSIPFLFLKSLVYVLVSHLAGDKIHPEQLSATESHLKHLESSEGELELQEKTSLFRSKVSVILALIGISVGYLFILLLASDYLLCRLH